MSSAYQTQVLITDCPARARMGGTHADIPVLHFAPFLEGVFDIQPRGTATEQAAWLRSLSEQASSLAILVERRQARIDQDAALATYPEASGVPSVDAFRIAMQENSRRLDGMSA